MFVFHRASMTKSGSRSTDPLDSTKHNELKRELQRLTKQILDDDSCTVESFDRAAKTLSELRRVKFRSSCNFDDDAIPVHFLCPISAMLMRDPVIVATGQTYERRFIEKWLEDGNRTCPQTMQVLSHLILTPNVVLRSMITQWCEKHGVEPPRALQGNDEEGITVGERAKLDSLLQMISFHSPDQQRQAAKELRSLTKRVRSFRALIGETPDAVPKLLSTLSTCNSNDDFQVQEDIVTTILNLSIHDNNKKLVSQTPNAIPLLIEALDKGSMEARSNAAAALFSLSALDCNKTVIADHGAIGPLVRLLEEGNPIAKKDAASAIFNLCIITENRGKVVEEGAVGVMLDIVHQQLLVDELLPVLALLSTHEAALDEMGRMGVVSMLLKIIRESKSGRTKENCVAILCSICINNRAKLKEVRDEEDRSRTLSQLSQNGTLRAQRKATTILDRLRRTAYTA